MNVIDIIALRDYLWCVKQERKTQAEITICLFLRCV